jgi:Ca2+-binding RTX toxin-like protein
MGLPFRVFCPASFARTGAKPYPPKLAKDSPYGGCALSATLATIGAAAPVGSVGKGEDGMRRVVLVLAAMALALVLASGVALAVNKVGTNGPDTLRGTNKADNLLGRGGNDDLFGLGGRDNLLGGPGKDNVLGGDERRASGGDKNLAGGTGNDLVLGGRGSDNLTGNSGNDFVDGGLGSDSISGGDGTEYLADGEFRGGATDTLNGGDGTDLLDAINKPANRDLVTCGGGFDYVFADTQDVVAPDCEKVAVGFAAVRELDQQLIESGFFEIFEGLPPFPEG